MAPNTGIGGDPSQLWRPDTDQSKPELIPGEVYRPDILTVIERTIDALRPALRTLSNKIHGESLTRPADHPSIHPDMICSSTRAQV